MLTFCLIEILDCKKVFIFFRLEIDIVGQHLHLLLKAQRAACERSNGILGSCNGNSTDDFQAGNAGQVSNMQINRSSSIFCASDCTHISDV